MAPDRDFVLCGPDDAEIMFQGGDSDAFCGLDGVSLVLDPP